MTDPLPKSSLQLRSLVTESGQLELSLADVPVPTVASAEVLVRVEAAPINPSDLGLLLAGADVASAVIGGTSERPVVIAPLADGALRSLSARVGKSLAVGNEGAGTVVAAGPSPEAQALVGQTVAVAGGSMYSQYRVVNASSCLLLPPGTSAKEGASSFVNPLTALGMIETMRREGHSGLVHTAAASNLGQMLVKLCLEEDVPLVTIVRKPEQARLLKSIGAVHVCDSSEPSFMSDLINAIKATSATLAFDATGGGKLVSQILTAMEAAANTSAGEYSRYGSTVHKQVYIYGGLDPNPTMLTRNFGFAWGIGGWLLTPFLGSIDSDTFSRLRSRVAMGLKTTFASTYTSEASLVGMLDPLAISRYAKQATGEKYLVVPPLDAL
ncbi:MAG TPA: zinc-binding dehydrogenase [Acidimicrobiales bacterium]|jgi:NADPH:quinone reductase-like Zn-dependent oxidoreductase